MSRLLKNERCPIHRRTDCCGRKKSGPREQFPRRGDVERIEDGHHPRGYREICSKREMRKRLILKLLSQGNLCGICKEPIEDFQFAVLDHIEPRPMGCRKDDHMDNLQAAHSSCNGEKGSKRLRGTANEADRPVGRIPAEPCADTGM